MKSRRKNASMPKPEEDGLRVGYAVEEERKGSRGILSRLRLLPLMIFAAALLLPLKLNNVWQGLGDVMNKSFSVAEAQQADQASPDGAMPEMPEAMPAPDGGEGGGAMTDAIAPPGEADSGAAARLLNEDPTLLTQAEIDLLNSWPNAVRGWKSAPGNWKFAKACSARRNPGSTRKSPNLRYCRRLSRA